MQTPINKETLKTLLGRFKLCIPIIQRDYAHGRPDAKARSVRAVLIDDIISCLEGGSGIDFNFVYGISLGDDIFYPVDGQQRVTTLYLFHWYLAVRSGGEIVKEFNRFKPFEYETRSSAAEFFRQLRKAAQDCEAGCENKAVAILCDSSVSSLEAALKDSVWYRHNWGNDPTVQSAITMLNDIHDKLRGREQAQLAEMYEALDKMTFQLELEKSEDAEALAAKSYLRMNARGKPLNGFENLKAMLDGIDSRCNAGKGYALSQKYDTKFINRLFNDAKSDTFDLEEVTREINKRSFAMFRNLYIVTCKLFGRECPSSNDDQSFINTIYGYFRSSSLAKEELELLDTYVSMTVRVFELYCALTTPCEGTKQVFDILFGNVAYFSREVLSLVFTALHSNLAPQDKEKQYLLLSYVCENLLVNGASHINALAEKSAAADVYGYFRSTSETDIADALTGVEAWRIKEQKIKAALLRQNNQDDYWFRALEARGDRSVRYLLYITDYWTGSGNFSLLTKYHPIAEKYFLNRENSLACEWKKLWAVSQYLDGKTALLPACDIEAQCGRYECWSDSFYCWGSDSALKENVPYLLRIKDTYDNVAVYLQRITQLANHGACWLRSAVGRDIQKLLDVKLEYDACGKIAVLANARTRYDMFLLKTTFSYVSDGIVPILRTRMEEVVFDPQEAKAIDGSIYCNDTHIKLNFLRELKIADIANRSFAAADCLSSEYLTMSAPKRHCYSVFCFTGNYVCDEYAYDITADMQAMLNDEQVAPALTFSALVQDKIKVWEMFKKINYYGFNKKSPKSFELSKLYPAALTASVNHHFL